LATGKILQFDQARGYGFVAADDGGEDVFLHASVFDGCPDVLVPGVKVAFQVMAGDRGRKAFSAHLAAVHPGTIEQPAKPASASPGPLAEAYAAANDEQMCDVLSPGEFRQELTELLLNAVPGLPSQDILKIRVGVLEFAKKHGWIDG
jgi:cold shock CspA family protein